MSDTEERESTGLPEQTRLIKIQKEKESLMQQLSEGILKTATARVAFILNHYPETRDSDRLLTLHYWEAFQNNLYNKGNITKDAYLKLEQQSDISRARAKIQNTFGEFQASETTRGNRAEREEVYRESQIQLSEDAVPITYIFYDETGKTQDYVSVGGLWKNGDSEDLRKAIINLRTEFEMEAKDEFHFTNVDKKNIENYIRLIDVVVDHSANIGFKALCFNQKGSGQKIDEIVTRLYTVGICDGLNHEIDTGRMTIPRTLNITKDREDSKDILLLESLKLDVETHIKATFDGKVRIGGFIAAESRLSHFIQVADIFMGCLNRRINTPEGNNIKDELAKYFFEKFGIDPVTLETKQYYDFINIRMLN